MRQHEADGIGRAVKPNWLAWGLPSLALLVWGCGRGGAAPREGGAGRDWQQDPAVFTLTGSKEIDVLGDVHGDPGVTERVLVAAGLITATAPYSWTGGSKVLVVTGDVIDKGAAATPIIDLLIALAPEAMAAGGRVVVTLGNHEAEFVADPTQDKSTEFRNELSSLGLDPAAVASGQTRYGAWLASRPVAALIDGWFFAHAGNSQGMSAGEIAASFQQRFDPGGVPSFDDPFLLGGDSLLEAQSWWAGGPSAIDTLDADLTALPAAHIVFGHDPGAIDFPDDPAGNRAAGEMATRYGGRIFLVDVGMSYAVGYSNGSILQIVRGPADAANQLMADGTSRPVWP
jgi:Calcineurin-like phosphoesterase